MRILIVEDEHRLGEHLAKGLREEGLATDLAASRARARVLMIENPYDLVLLDLMLPDGDGLALLRDWRREGYSTPVLALTARDLLADKIAGLDAGADDYLTKPFAFEELLARIRALLRRRGAEPVDVVSLGNLALDRTARRVRRGDRAIDLTPKEFALLEHFLLHPGATLTRAEIAEHVWDERYEARSNVIDVMVARLRRKLEAGGASRILHSVPGMGYVLRSSAHGEPGA
ncbi:MAG: response regulator transcription factor [Thermoanaerobaculia bacterium]